MVERAGLRAAPESLTANYQPAQIESMAGAWDALGKVIGQVNEKILKPIAVAHAQDVGYAQGKAGTAKLRIADSDMDEAYNHAAMSGYLARISVDASQRLDEIETDPNNYLNVDNYRAAAENVAKEFINHATGGFAPAVSEFFDRQIAEGVNRVATRVKTKTIQDGRDSVKANLTRLENQGSSFGWQTDPSQGIGSNAWDAWRGEYDAAIDAAKNPLFGFTPAELDERRDQTYAKISGRAAAEAVRNEYEAHGLQAAEGLAKTLISDPKLQLNDAQREAYLGDAVREVRGLEAQKRRDALELQKEIHAEQRDLRASTRLDLADAKESLAHGASVAEDAVKDMEDRALRAGDPSLLRQVQQLKAQVSAKPTIDLMNPRQLAGAIEELRAKIAKDGGSSGDVAVLGYMQSRQGDLRQGLASDTIGVAINAGLVPPDKAPDIDMSHPDPAALRQRAAVAEDVGHYYEQQPTYFRPYERAKAKDIEERGGDELLNLAQAIAKGGRRDAPAMLRELRASPLLAHLGAVLAEGGSHDFAFDVAQAQKLKKDGSFEPSLPKDARLDARSDASLQQAWSSIPGGYAQMRQAADLAYEARALRGGGNKWARDVLDTKAYDRALQESSGARFEPSGQWGGVQVYRGRGVLIPSWIKADKFDDVIASLQPSDLQAMGGLPRGRSGAYPIGMVRQAKLVSIGAGRYRVFFGDPDGQAPQQAMTAGGREYVLDLAAIRNNLAAKHPDWVKGG